jgi:hypothetical protein
MSAYGTDRAQPALSWPNLPCALKELDGIKREIEVLSAHCTASKDEIRAAAREYHLALEAAQATTEKALFYKWAAEDRCKALKVKLRRLRN